MYIIQMCDVCPGCSQCTAENQAALISLEEFREKRLKPKET
jgi:hypothetical protein